VIDKNYEEFQKTNILTRHEKGYKGKGSIVVVLDDAGKPYELTNVIDPFNDNKDGYGHKSQVSQVVREVAPEADIVVFSWFKGFKQEIVDWIKEHEEEISFINCSFNTRIQTEIFEQLEDVDIPIIVSSGNSADDEVGSGAEYPWTIAVGAWEEYRDNRARYSNYGEDLDIVAYTNIFINTPSGNKMMFNGTSCSAPMVCGMLAIYDGWRKENGLSKMTRDETLEFVRSNTIDKLEEGFDFESGHGLFILPSEIPQVDVVIEEPVEEPIEGDDDLEFKDMQGHWAEQYVDFVSEKGIMTGFPDETFKPDNVMTRAEVATVIARMLGFEVEKK
jgi:hypothetical protein